MSMRGSGLKLDRRVVFAIGFMITALIAAFILPTAIGTLEDPERTTVTQEEGEVVDLAPTLNATLNEVDDGDSSINVTVADTSTNASASATSIAVGANETVTLEGSDITINNTANVNTTTATIRYEYPSDYSWSSGESAMFGLLPMLFALVMLLYIIGRALEVF